MKYLICVFVGYLLGFHNGWYMSLMNEEFKHNEHKVRCKETDKYWQYMSIDNDIRICFRQSKLTNKIERTTLVYNSNGL